jgi:hypothetical protein
MAKWPVCDNLVAVRDSTSAPQRARGRRNKGSDARGFLCLANHSHFIFLKMSNWIPAMAAMTAINPM